MQRHPRVTKVLCSRAGCGQPAVYKLAARWSDGEFSELKTYGHACEDCLRPVFKEAEQRWLDHPTAPSETIEELGIYRFEQGKRDRDLQRLWGLEENYRTRK